MTGLNICLMIHETNIKIAMSSSRERRDEIGYGWTMIWNIWTFVKYWKLKSLCDYHPVFSGIYSITQPVGATLLPACLHQEMLHQSLLCFVCSSAFLKTLSWNWLDVHVQGHASYVKLLEMMLTHWHQDQGHFMNKNYWVYFMFI